VPVEFLTWSVNVSTFSVDGKNSNSKTRSSKAISKEKRVVFDPNSGRRESLPMYLRKDLAAGASLAGPALVAEPQTTTLVPRGWRCGVAAAGHLILERTK